MNSDYDQVKHDEEVTEYEEFKDDQQVLDFEEFKEEAADYDVFKDDRMDDQGAQIVSGPEDITVTKGQSATMTVHFIGYPTPEVNWLKKDTVLGDEEGHFMITVEEDWSNLTVQNVTADDTAKYTAVVSNRIGAHASFASLSVEDVPEPPATQPNLSEVCGGGVTLSWYGPGYDGGSVVTGYTVHARKVGHEKWDALVQGWHSTSFKVAGLEVGGQYEFRVFAQNVHGLSSPSKLSQPITLEGDGHEEQHEETDDLIEATDFSHTEVSLEDGTDFDKRFGLHEEIGKGRYGVVYRCTDSVSGRTRAAKIIKCIKTSEKEKVREEISIMNSLRNCKLLQLAAAYEKNRQIIMIMEYISGGELFERVAADDFTLTEWDVILFMRQIVEGVQYMHDNNILHLDLKPENILCVKRNSHHIKLIDFGLARRFYPSETCRVLFGTPEFIAPEIINYEPISYATDMWAVGVVCYVLLSGLSPFMGNNDAETFANITLAEFDFDDDAFVPISAQAKGFIQALLVKRKEDRLTSHQCLNHPWLIQSKKDLTTRVIPTEKLKSYNYRRKWQATPHKQHTGSTPQRPRLRARG